VRRRPSCDVVGRGALSAAEGTSMQRRLLLAPVLLLLGACTALVDPASLNVEVVVKGVPVTAATVEVELTPSTGTVLHREMGSGAAERQVFFASVPDGDITITAKAFDQDHLLLAQADTLHDTASKVLKTLVAELRVGPAPCVAYDSNGFSCREPLAPLTFLPSRLTPLAGAAGPVLVTGPSDAPATILVRAGQDPLSVTDRTDAPGILRSPDAASAVVPDDGAGARRLSLVRTRPAVSVTPLDAKVAPGNFGFLADGTLWLIDGADRRGGGKLRVVAPDEVALQEPPDACLGLVHRPLRVAADAGFVAFEVTGGTQNLAVLRSAAACDGVKGTDGLVALTGSWSLGEDGSTWAAAVDGLLVFGTADAGPKRLEPLAKPDGATAITKDLQIYASTGEGILLVDASTGDQRIVAGRVLAVAAFEVSESVGTVTAMTADGLLVAAHLGKDGFVGPEHTVTPTSRLVAADGSLVAWEPAVVGDTPGAWFVDPSAAPPADILHRIDASVAGDGRRWARADGDVLVVGTPRGLFDARANTRLAPGRTGLAWDVGPSGLVYVENSGGQAPYLLTKPGSRAVGLASSAAAAIACVPGSTDSFVVAFVDSLNGVSLARIKLPKVVP
jgi:hypothetical protein